MDDQGEQRSMIEPERAGVTIVLKPLGDQAALIYFADEAVALRYAAAIRRTAEPWLIDVVQSYASLAVFFDLARVRFPAVADFLGKLELHDETRGQRPGVTHAIPCCYDFALDLERVARHAGLSGEDVVRLHCETEYTVYAIGFCPGFPYMGYLPEALCGVSRLQAPRVQVEAGSVGLTGRQTGIYTEARPGGWNIIGRTPLELVKVAEEYFPIRTGDRVRFVRIDKHEFNAHLGERLPARQPELGM
jgi:inhibitor of KinA